MSTGWKKNGSPPKFQTQLLTIAHSAMVFNLRVWTREYINRPGVLKSRLYYEIARRFREKGIEIPFPQRDVHIKEAPGKVQGAAIQS